MLQLALVYKNGMIENTGNTGIVAHIIQEKTKGDMFSVQTVNKYPSTYNETVNQGKQEHENNIRPELDKSYNKFR